MRTAEKFILTFRTYGGQYVNFTFLPLEDAAHSCAELPCITINYNYRLCDIR